MNACLNPREECVIVINCGSSSVKLAAIPSDGGEVIFSALAERLGTDGTVLHMNRSSGRVTLPIPGATHRVALENAAANLGGLRPVAVGHRIVHGAEEFTGAVLITPEVMDAVGRYAALAPLHNPANLTGVRTAQDLFPNLAQVAVFDTAFHQTMPPRAFLYAIPYSYYEERRARRYGFHGTSHHYVGIEAARLLGKPFRECRLITMHLGNGCSACAIQEGRSLDCTMGMTPGEGLVMGTRSGDVDPSLHQFIQNQTGLDLAEITSMLNSQSGLLGLSGLSNDMRTLAEASAGGHARATLAIEVFCYRLARGVAGLTSALDRLDALVFTGGIGENAAPIRALAMSHLKILGVRLDPELNATHGRDSNRRISAPGSASPCFVVPTNEELMIARETVRLITVR